MADTKISAMTAASTLTGAELVPVVQSGTNVQTTTGAIGGLTVGNTPLTSGNIFVGSAANMAASVTPSGDITLSNTGVTAVAKIAGTAVTTPTGTGAVVLAASPTLSGTVAGTYTLGGTPTITGLAALNGVTVGGTTGTGNLVFSAAPVFTGTVSFNSIPNAVGMNVTSSPLPVTGIYRPATNQLGFSTATTVAGIISSAQAWRFNAYGAGTATFDASGNITSVSDERMKYVLGPFTATVENIDPIIYKWRAESGNETAYSYAGFSAQNVKAAIGHLGIGEDAHGNLTLQDRAVLAAAVNTIKALIKRVEELEGRL